MKKIIIAKLIFLAIMTGGSITVLAQDDGIKRNEDRGGRGNRGGGQGQHRGQKARIYRSVKAIEIFSNNGESIYAYGSEPAAKGKGKKPVIDRVEKKNAGVKLIFAAGTPQENVVEILCADCIVRVNYNKEDQH